MRNRVSSRRLGKAKRHPTNPGIQIRRSLPVCQGRFLPGGVKKPSRSRRLGKAKRHPTNPGIQIRRSLPVCQGRFLPRGVKKPSR
ncbi:MAG: hypothetical protein ABWU13_25935, partial [Limnospira maxima]